MEPERHDPYGALRHSDYLRYVMGGVLARLGVAMQTVAVGWDLYERTGSALALGGVGLAQFLPIVLLAVPAGHLADRISRRRIVLWSETVAIGCSLGLAALSMTGGPLAGYYVLLAVSAVARAFIVPAGGALWTTLIPPDLYSNAVTWRSGGFQAATVCGPALGGMLIAWRHSAAPAYLANAVLTLFYWLAIYRIADRPQPARAEALSWRSLLAGFHFVWQTKVVLAAITLDMFAVLFGGATALLPIYAKDILRVGPAGFGLLRAAPAAGALLMTLVVAHRRPTRRAGDAMLWSVIGFGVATIVFGFSRSLWLSLAALALTGAADTISVVVRQSLVQLQTPDAMRGRVTAVNSVFISCSNELGAFESGTVAALFGPVASVVSGGVGTILVVVAVALIWPQLRHLKELREAEEIAEIGDLE